MRSLEVGRTQIVGLSLFVFLILGVATSAQAANQDPKLWLEVKSDESALKLSSAEAIATCPVSGWGDLCFSPGNNGKITIKLHGDSDCSREEGAKWDLSSVYIGGEGSATKPVSWGGISDGAASDFTADKVTGLVTTVPPTNNELITIEDKNEYEIVVWYKVEAICVKQGVTYGDPILFDPRVRNGGTN